MYLFQFLIIFLQIAIITLMAIWLL